MGINFAFINQRGIKVRAVAGYERWGVEFQKSHVRNVGELGLGPKKWIVALINQHVALEGWIASTYYEWRFPNRAWRATLIFISFSTYCSSSMIRKSLAWAGRGRSPRSSGQSLFIIFLLLKRGEKPVRRGSPLPEMRISKQRSKGREQRATDEVQSPGLRQLSFLSQPRSNSGISYSSSSLKSLRLRSFPLPILYSFSAEEIHATWML